MVVFLLLSFVFLFGSFFIVRVQKQGSTKSERLRVGVIDGIPSALSNVKVTQHVYAKGDTNSKTHANIVWSLLLAHTKLSRVQFFEYAVIGKHGEINRDIFLKALKQAERDQINIINFSGGFYTDDPTIKAEIDRLQKKHVVIIAAAGNHSAGSADFPARIKGVISVGSKHNGKISIFSPQEKINIYANGENISYRNEFYQGTSFATPKVTNYLISECINHQQTLQQAKENLLKKGETP